MLKKIPAILPPKLVEFMMEMGEGEEILLGGADAATGEAKRVVRMDGISMCDVLKAILALFPLHEKIAPVTLVQADEEAPIWKEYEETIRNSEEAKKFKEFDFLDKYSFENRSSKAYAVVITGERQELSSMILTKGKVR